MRKQGHEPMHVSPPSSPSVRSLYLSLVRSGSMPERMRIEPEPMPTATPTGAASPVASPPIDYSRAFVWANNRRMELD